MPVYLSMRLSVYTCLYTWAPRCLFACAHTRIRNKQAPAPCRTSPCMSAMPSIRPAICSMEKAKDGLFPLPQSIMRRVTYRSLCQPNQKHNSAALRCTQNH